MGPKPHKMAVRITKPTEEDAADESRANRRVVIVPANSNA